KKKQSKQRKDNNHQNTYEKIRAKKVIIIQPDEDHKVVDLQEALDIAASYDLDLVEVAPKAKPPVCKVMDFGKYMYKKKKQEKEAKKKQHTVQVKELRFTPNTEAHDLEFKTRHARGFLEDGDKVKATVQFRGRDMLYTERGEELLYDLAEELDDIGEIESKPNMEGRRMIMMLSPK